jgi:hypothetical protein
MYKDFRRYHSFNRVICSADVTVQFMHLFNIFNWQLANSRRAPQRAVVVCSMRRLRETDARGVPPKGPPILKNGAVRRIQSLIPRSTF